jgi:hypothetical protein
LNEGWNENQGQKEQAAQVVNPFQRLRGAQLGKPVDVMPPGKKEEPEGSPKLLLWMRFMRLSESKKEILSRFVSHRLTKSLYIQ